MSSRPLEPSPAQTRALAEQVVDSVVGYLERLPSLPASDVTGVADLLADPEVRRRPAESGRPLGQLLEVLDRAAAKGFNPSSPGYLAFIPGSGIVTAALADLLADILNRYTGVTFPAPGLVALEQDVLRWTCDLFGLPEGAQGLLTSGGSLANFSALVTARSERLPEDFLAGTVYVTDQVHQSMVKAARLAGLPPRNVRVVASTPAFRMDVAALDAAVSADRSAGLTPFCVVASAGTTNTGAVDPLSAVADLAAEHGLWLHVDAAYGGFFQLTARGRERLAGIDRADSITLDPHKSLFLPFGTGCLLVRDGQALRRAHSGDAASYLQDIDDVGLPDFADYGPELTRDFRGLRMWLPLQLHGVAAFRDTLDEKLDLAEHAFALLAADPGLEVLGAPDLSTFAFACRVRGGDTDAADAATADLLARVNAEGRILMSSTRLRGRFAIRVSVLNHRTDRARIDEGLEAIRRHAAGSATARCTA